VTAPPNTGGAQARTEAEDLREKASQNRDSAAIQVKLDKLIRVSKANNSSMGLEHLTDEEPRHGADYRAWQPNPRKSLAPRGPEATRLSLTGSRPRRYIIEIGGGGRLGGKCGRGSHRSQSPRPGGTPNRPPVPAGVQLNFRPSDTQKRRSAPGMAGLLQSLAKCAEKFRIGVGCCVLRRSSTTGSGRTALGRSQMSSNGIRAVELSDQRQQRSLCCADQSGTHRNSKLPQLLHDALEG
jgi:hypothetical protein